MDKYTASVNKLVAKGLAKAVTADGSTALRIRCVAAGRQSSSYADAVIVSATSIVLSVNGVTDTSFAGGTGTLLFATYTTLGALVDQINTSGNWQAEIVAGVRADAISGSQLLARSTSTFRMYQEIKLMWDSSVCARLDIILESLRPFESRSILSTSIGEHRVGFQRVIALQNNGDSSAPTLDVYELDGDKASTTANSELTSVVMADNTEKDSGVDAPFIHVNYGKSILVRLASSSWSDTGAYLKVFGVRE